VVAVSKEVLKRAAPVSAVVLATIVGVVLVLYAWRLPPFRSPIESTEDAYVRGSITVIAPKVDGYVAEVLVQDFANVEAGQLIVRLDDRNYKQKLAQALATQAAQEANLANVVQARHVREASIESASAAMQSARAQQANAQAQLVRARTDGARVSELVQDGSVSQRETDQVEAALRQAEAAQRQADAAFAQARAAHAASQQDLKSVIVNRDAIEAAVAGARAAVQLAQIDLDNTLVRAPVAGTLGEIGVKLGQYATPGTQLVMLVPRRIWVVANFKEAQTAHIRVGQPAVLRVDALSDAEIKGRVENIAPATGSEFSVLRPDNATGNFTKIAQRLPVRIAVDLSDALALRLRPGMSVVASVDTSQGARP
jgi:multidrug resistance efflux pump